MFASGGLGGGPQFSLSPSTTTNCISLADADAPETPEPANRTRPAPPSPEVLAQIASDRAIALAAQPSLQIAPAEIGLTGLESYFWLDEPLQPIVARAAAGGLVVTAEARPAQYRWDFDDGAEKVTDHPGRPWSLQRPGNISHLYETRGLYNVEVEVIWGARWRLGNGAWRHLGFFSTADERAYPVRQVVAVLTETRH